VGKGWKKDLDSTVGGEGSDDGAQEPCHWCEEAAGVPPLTGRWFTAAATAEELGFGVIGGG
jgi:hypothetical protein